MGYTQGKWTIAYDGQEYIIYADHYEIARVFIHNGEQESNANMIKAAPDMYKALKKLTIIVGTLERINEDTIKYPELYEAERALATAEGQ